MARPIKWDERLISEYKQKILDDIAINGMSLRQTLRQKDYPDIKYVLAWLNEDKEFSIQYARCCEIRADLLFDDILDICDATSDDIIFVDGKEIENHNVINRDRLRIDSRKWILSKMNPKKYGDKIDLTNKGEKFENISTLVLPDAMKKD